MVDSGAPDRVLLVPACDEPLTPRPHQVDAIASAVTALGEVPRCQVVMACGTGKTLVGQRVSEALAARGCTLVLFPTLGLLDQTARKWAAASARPYEVLAVCSDDKIGLRADEVDESGVKVADLEMPVASDPEEVRDWVSDPARAGVDRVVFCTYQSSDVIAAAHRLGLPEWDLIIADEAHRMAGPNDGLFATALHQRRVPASRRLFLTATPRVHAPRMGGAEAEDLMVLSMDDPELFGVPAYQLTFPEAINRGLLSDYRVAVIGVTDAEVSRLIDANPDLGELDAKAVAAQIATALAVRKYRLRSLLGFHNRVTRSRAFTQTLRGVVDSLDEDRRPPGPAIAAHVDSRSSTEQRQNALRLLAEAPLGQGWAMVNNVRCLSEGIDVPVLDGVLIAERRTSTVDITQAVGRAIRRNPLREADSIILLPVVLTEDQDPEAVLDASDFRHVYQALRALQDHDTRLEATFVRMRRQRDRSEPVDPDFPLDFLFPSSVPAQLRRALSVRLVERLSSAFEVGLAELRDYKAVHGDVNVPKRYVTPTGYNLGTWAQAKRNIRRANQRYQAGDRTHGWLTAEQIRALDELGFSWDPKAAGWEAGIAHLKTYKAEHGHLRVPQRYTDPTGFNLGSWMTSRRGDLKAGRLSDERIAELDSLGFAWDVFWDTGLAELVRYRDEHGHARVPTSWTTADGFNLGLWVAVRRKQYRQGTLSRERIDRLESLGVSWTPEADDWEAAFSAWETAVNELGVGWQIPAQYTTPTGQPLGNWLARQRERLKTGRLKGEQLARIRAVDPNFPNKGKKRREPIKREPDSVIRARAKQVARIFQEHPEAWVDWRTYPPGHSKAASRLAYDLRKGKQRTTFEVLGLLETRELTLPDGSTQVQVRVADLGADQGHGGAIAGVR